MSVPPPTPPSTELLSDALQIVQQQSVLMRRNLETPGKLMDALKCSSTLVSELRTSSLAPKQYYELYMAVFDALRHLSAYLRDNHPVNHLADLYELVQYAGNIVPRLYLMITVGTVYMSIEDAPVKEIMKDMMEMSRGVQHPMRGLFLRYYLMGQSRDYLPTGTGDGPEGNIQDSISFILTNFIEMNKLWVRLQHQGHSREREKRLQERKELQLLVGSNIVRLSQLVDLDTYKNVILAPLLEQVVQCRDVLAQEYLLEVITQVFPDEFHLHTLDQFLSATAHLNPAVNIKAIVIGIMDRLSNYATKDAEAEENSERLKKELNAAQAFLERLSLREVQKNAQKEKPGLDYAAAISEGGESAATEDNGETAKEGEGEKKEGEEQAKPAPEEPAEPEIDYGDDIKNIPKDIKLFEVFYEQVVNLVNAQQLAIQDTTALLVSLTNLALKIYPDRLEYVDRILDYTTKKVTELANSPDLHAPPAQQSLLNLLLAPVTTYVSLFTVLSLPSYLPLLASQSYQTRRTVAGAVIQSLLKNQTKIQSVEHCEGVLGLVKVLIKEGAQQATYPGIQPPRRGGREIETEETVEEQGWLARLIHLLDSPINDTQFRLLQATRKAFAEGGDRVKYTSPALITACVKLARRYKRSEKTNDNWSQMSTALYKFMHQTISHLNTRVGAPELCLRLYVFAGQVADQCGFEDFAYEFFAQAFTVYEESISDSRAQFQAVAIIGGALQMTRNFGKENYDTLITKCALHSSKLLKKPDQCRAVYLASHLWWATEIPARGEDEKTELYRDGKRVLECLQRALRVADACMDTAVSVELFVEILGRYVYYYERQNEAVAVRYINGLIELIHSNLNSNPESTANETPRKHFERTLAYIKSRGFEEVVTEMK